MANSETEKLAQTLINSVNKIASISGNHTPMKKHCGNLSRRLKLLLPMLEEIRDCKESMISDEVLLSLKDSLVPAKDLFVFVSHVSKIYLVLERDKVMIKFQKVTAQLEQALTRVPYENLGISDELKEQVELILTQLRRSLEKGEGVTHDDELYSDLVYLYSDTSSETNSETLRRVVKKLQLMTITDLTQESLALLDMVSSSGGDDPGQSFEKMCMLLKKIKDFVQTDNPNLNDSPVRPKSPLPESQQDGDQNVPEPPEDFRCPISLELMVDPVILSSGQTYERECVQKWLRGGHVKCPKTQETLTSDTVTPNYALRSLIAQWCESNGIEPPKRPNNSQLSSKASTSSPLADEQDKIEELIDKLTSQNPEDQRYAAREIRHLAKWDDHYRVGIAASGAIPFLVNLLTISYDSETQEHAVTAIYNLSLCGQNKGTIGYSSGAVSGIIHVLQKGSMEARENAAATLFSLSHIFENNVMIGAAGAIPPLVTLLSEGSQRGKKDAVKALCNLFLCIENRTKTVRAGIVPVLMQLLREPECRLVDVALALLDRLSSYPDGKIEVEAAHAVSVMLDFMRRGSPQNKEHAAAVLVHLCSWDELHLVEAQSLGIMSSLIEMAENGTDRGKRKAGQLLEQFSRFNDEQREFVLGVEEQISLI